MLVWFPSTMVSTTNQVKVAIEIDIYYSLASLEIFYLGEEGEGQAGYKLRLSIYVLDKSSRIFGTRSPPFMYPINYFSNIFY